MTDIVTVPSGNYTPGALAALQNAAALINASWNQANLKTANFESKVDGVEAWLDTAPVADVTPDTVVGATVVEPAVDIPATASATDVMTMFDTKYLELVALLSDKFTAFRNTYFPNDQDAYAAVETFLQDSLANPEVGLPANVAAQIHEDDRSRILADAARASDAMMAVFAARRFPLPPGAAAAAELAIQQKAQEEIAASSRKLTALSIEQIKFAIDKTVSMRQAAMQSAVAYIQALASGPDMASKLVGVGYDAQSKLISAASGFYGARIEAARLANSVSQFNVSTKLAADEKNQAVDLALVEERMKALLNEAQALSQMATSMFNNLHASAGTSYNVSIT